MLHTEIGSPYANSYLTLAKADDVMPLHDRSWSRRPLSEKEFLLRASASDIDRIPFLGTKLFYGQGMQFPRKGNVIVEAYTITSGFSYVEGTYTEEKTVTSDEDVSYTRQSTQDTVTFLFTNEGFLAASPGDRDIILSGPVTNSAEWTLRITLSETMVAEAGTVRRVWKVTSVDVVDIFNTSSPQEIPEILPDFEMAPAGMFTIRAVNGSPINVPSEVMTATGVLRTHTVTEVSGRLPTKLSNSALIFTDRTDILPTFCLGGAVHAIEPAERVYANVIGHDISTGTLTLDREIPTYLAGDKFTYIDPLPEALYTAQIEQLKVRTGSVMSDPFAGTGIKSIKVGDTSRTYGDTPGAPGQTVIGIAGRLGVSVRTIILLGKYSLYGKTAIGWQQRLEDVLETSTTSTAG